MPLQARYTKLRGDFEAGHRYAGTSSSVLFEGRNPAFAAKVGGAILRSPPAAGLGPSVGSESEVPGEHGGPGVVAVGPRRLAAHPTGVSRARSIGGDHLAR